MSYNYPYKLLANDVMFELSKSHDPNIIDKFIKELRKLSKQEKYNGEINDRNKQNWYGEFYR